MIIVISGPSNSGKSTVAKAISKSLHIPVANVGDLMLDAMQRDPVCHDRSAIGRAFLAEFGRAGYCELIGQRIGQGPCILDGVRLTDAIDVASACAPFLHIDRSKPAVDEEFDTASLRSKADLLSPWLRRVEQVEPYVDHLVSMLIGMSSQRAA